jgi:transketolase
MGLEDLSMMRSILNSIVFYPSDAVSTFKLTQIMAGNPGIFYLRTTRKKMPVIYDEKEKFVIGGSKIHQSPCANHQSTLIITAGITLHEALKAQKELTKENIETVVMDCYSIKPIDKETIHRLAAEIKNIIIVEDHYPAGGLGEAVLSALNNYELTSLASYNFKHLCIKKLPRSGTSEELLAYEEIDANGIIKAVKSLS